MGQLKSETTRKPVYPDGFKAADPNTPIQRFNYPEDFFKEKSASGQTKHARQINAFGHIWEESNASGAVYFLHAEGPRNSVGQAVINGNSVTNFGSCSYFGLEVDARLKQAAIEAIQTYGVQYSSSVACVSVELYAILEDYLKQIFGYPTLVTPSTTLGHLACLPIVIDDNDVVILDQQVHNSVQMAVKTVIASNTKVITIPHNDLEALERKIIEHQTTCNKIWYLLDGVYSMYGDFAPLDQIEMLKEKYPQLQLYIDDAHGMSWQGEHGRGYALSQLKNMERTIVATSHSKCFGCAGGSLIIPDPELYNQVKRFGPTRIFSGPLQPPLLGANIASAKIHLSDEIYILQKKLKDKIAFRNVQFEQNRLPFPHKSESPVMFISIGDHKITANICRTLREKGCYVNPAIFPVIGLRKSGLRITTSIHQTDDEIQRLAQEIAGLLPEKKLSKL